MVSLASSLHDSIGTSCLSKFNYYLFQYASLHPRSHSGPAAAAAKMPSSASSSHLALLLYLLVAALLAFLLCSSAYLVYRVHLLQMQVGRLCFFDFVLGTVLALYSAACLFQVEAGYSSSSSSPLTGEARLAELGLMLDPEASLRLRKILDVNVDQVRMREKLRIFFCAFFR